jgi:hypothetical protein
VLGKTQVGKKPTAFVTVGKPFLVETAVQNSFDNGVTLLTNKAIVEAVLQVLEGRRTIKWISDRHVSRGICVGSC